MQKKKTNVISHQQNKGIKFTCSLTCEATAHLNVLTFTSPHSLHSTLSFLLFNTSHITSHHLNSPRPSHLLFTSPQLPSHPLSSTSLHFISPPLTPPLTSSVSLLPVMTVSSAALCKLPSLSHSTLHNTTLASLHPQNITSVYFISPHLTKLSSSHFYF